eukprot:2304645-Rhodomonas_salina.1
MSRLACLEVRVSRNTQKASASETPMVSSARARASTATMALTVVSERQGPSHSPSAQPQRCAWSVMSG